MASQKKIKEQKARQSAFYKAKREANPASKDYKKPGAKKKDAKAKTPPKKKDAKAKAKAKPKTKAKAKVGTPKVVGGAAALARGGPWTAAAILAAGGITKLLGAGFSYATRGGKPKQADRDLLARQRILSKAIGKQPGSPEMAIQGGIEKKKPVKAQPKVAQKLRPSPESDIMGGSGIPMRKLPKGERAYQAEYETNQPPSAPLASSKKVKATSQMQGKKPAKISTKGLSSGTGKADDDDATIKQSKKPAAKKPVVVVTTPGAKKAAKKVVKKAAPKKVSARVGDPKEAIRIHSAISAPRKPATVTAKENPMGRSIDNVLRGIFSFAGALPQASDIEAPKSRQRKDQEKRFKQFLVK
jgi:hypothetical protein